MVDFLKKDTHPFCPCPAFVGLGADRVRGTMPKPGMEVDPAKPRWRASSLLILWCFPRTTWWIGKQTLVWDKIKNIRNPMVDFLKIDTHPLCPCPAWVGLGAERVRETMPNPPCRVLALSLSPGQPPGPRKQDRGRAGVYLLFSLKSPPVGFWCLGLECGLDLG